MMNVFKENGITGAVKTEDVLESNTRKKNWLWTFITRPAVLLLIFSLIGFIYHPKWMNIRIYFGNSEDLVPMNYVSNFYLWTRYNPHDAQKVIVGGTDRLYESNLKKRKTFILIHGFTRTALERWILNMKNALLRKEDCNVISVDWEAGSLSMGYYVIQERVPLVGEDIAKLVSFLASHTSLTVKDFHIIGHSLGAHIAGFTGKHLNGTLARITGLDPASIAYNGAASKDRLDSSDASFVDVIHTHGCYTIINQFTDCYGTYDNMGHADFWPNGGEHQTACDEGGDGRKAVRESSNCHHGLAYVYYTESINHFPTSTRFLARKCSSYEFFNNGSCECPSPPQYMGYNVNQKVHGVFYLNTSKTTPYAILDPSCSPAEFSLIKILGLFVCFHLIFFGLVYSVLNLASSWVKRDLIHLTLTKSSEHYNYLRNESRRKLESWKKNR